MKRKQFILTSLASIPAFAIGANQNESNQRTGKGFVVRSGEGRYGEKTMLGGKNPNDIKISGKDTDNALTVFEYIGFTKGGPPLHVHKKQDEIFIVTEGEYLFQVGEEKYTLKNGDTIFLPRKVPHTFYQLTEKGKMIFMFQPSGKMEDFFRALAAKNIQTSKEEIEKLFATHDMNIVGPPLESKGI